MLKYTPGLKLPYLHFNSQHDNRHCFNKELYSLLCILTIDESFIDSAIYDGHIDEDEIVVREIPGIIVSTASTLPDGKSLRMWYFFNNHKALIGGAPYNRAIMPLGLTSYFGHSWCIGHQVEDKDIELMIYRDFEEVKPLENRSYNFMLFSKQLCNPDFDIPT